MNECFHVIWRKRSGILGSYGASQIFDDPSHHFQLSLNQFTFLLTVYENYFYSTSSPMLVISCLFDNSHSNRHEVKIHFGFDLHFPKPVHSEGDQPWDFFGRNDAKAETPVLWPPHAKS